MEGDEDEPASEQDSPGDLVAEATEYGLELLGVAAPVSLGKKVVDGLLARTTIQGKLLREYLKLQKVHESAALEKLIDETVSETVGPLAVAADQQLDVLDRVEKLLIDRLGALDQIVELLRRQDALLRQSQASSKAPHTPLVLPPRYLVGQGWGSLRQVVDGQEVKHLAACFRWDLPPLRFARELARAGARLGGRGLGYYPNVDALIDAGAPLPPGWSYRNIPALEGVLALGIDEGTLLANSDPVSEPIDGWMCDGASAFNVFGSYADDVKIWALENLENEDVFGTISVELPCVVAREAHFVGLIISPGQGGHVRVEGRIATGDVSLTLSMDRFRGRDLFIPIGTFLAEKASTGPIENWSEVQDPADASIDIDSRTVTISRVQHPDWFRQSGLVGPWFIPKKYQVDGEQEIEIRPPVESSSYERITSNWVGASCPEVFVRETTGPWRYVGAILVGANGPANARADELLLDVRDGEIVIREVSTEIAFVSFRLVARGPCGERVLEQRPDLVIDSRTVIRFQANGLKANESLVLFAHGYFIEVVSHPSEGSAAG